MAVEACEGNDAQTATMSPVTCAFESVHRLSDVTVVADAGMGSEANQIALPASGSSLMLCTRPDGLVLDRPWADAGAEKTPGVPDRVIDYQYRHRVDPYPTTPATVSIKICVDRVH